MKDRVRNAIIDKHRWRNVTAFLNPPDIEGLRVDPTEGLTRKRIGILSAYPMDILAMSDRGIRRAPAGTDWNWRRPRGNVGIFKLQVAILAQALQDLCKDGAGVRGVRIKRDAEAWLRSDDSSHPFTFQRICDGIDISADWVRKRIFKHGTRSDT